MDLSVVIPVYNEATGLTELRRRLTETLEKDQISFEVIMVDDGSQDDSRKLMVEFHQTDERFRALFLSRNFGHQIAITAGMMHASGDTVAIMDADLQDPPEAIPTFVKKLREGYDVVYGVRRKRKEHIFKRLAYYVFYRLLAKLSDYPIPLDSGDFCLMTRRMVDHLNRMPEKHRYLRGLRAWSGFMQTGIEYERESRYSGKSKYTVTKLFNLALDGLISFSAIPVRLIIQFGFLTALTSFVIGV
ncbi:MAG: glycosyltransferase family 2 protein, partial [bacterium]|nr:glycosyltransferase family 2 protein [bacterium]